MKLPRFPFVPRSVYDESVELRRSERAELLKLIADERRRSEYLMDLVVSMKLSGASIARAGMLSGPMAGLAGNVPDGAVKLPRKPVSALRRAVERAIDDNKYAKSIPGLHAHLMRVADKELAREDMSEADEEKILHRFQTWSAVQAEADDGEEDDDDDDLIALETLDEEIEQTSETIGTATAAPQEYAQYRSRR